MLKNSQQQISERWDILPISLREALCSPEYGKIIWRIGIEHHLDDRKIGIIAGIAGYIVYGFLHSDDLAREIQESLNLNSQIANSISHEINRKIFAPIKIDLEKIYSPISAMPFGATRDRPEIYPPTKAEPKPAVFPADTEVQKIPAIKLEIPISPAAPVISAPIVPTAVVPVEKPLDKTQDKPFILHRETEAKPVGEKQQISSPAVSWFQKAMPTGRRAAPLDGQEKPKAPEKPVKIELETFGPKIEKKKEPVSAKTEAPKQRIVHYRETEISTPFGKAQNRPFSKLEDSLPKPVKPAITILDAFEKTEREESEVRLEGNTINLKNNKSNS
ncbi:hypothetical protein A2819_00890 [Candidatus Azambacteria bacterium RIFCSPHIGHO2_01_FULL_40_24]|uniref:Uncharacterized protein n=1 Tax=Candidatus Azambacteria bacterium RIFCSPHIGHO2_01_FULL_40_24 TaxID=1797301 RepID=A0A1F5B3A7_9BACT|nr:MAG: hypothetical protein A2819_00890 [Candidatus Azambacteria bacterium RIFCSPHIGHO2_01_FULL_40_24]